MNDKQKFELAVQYLTELLGARKAPNTPPELMDDPAFLRLDEMIRTLREGIFSLGRGDLSGQIREKGYAAGVIKQLQGSLRHLVWQSRAIAAGDFSQKVDFLGDFSDAFNEMAGALGERTEQLRRSESKYRTLFENAAESIAVVADGRVLLANAILGRLSGVEADMLSGTPFADLFVPQDRQAVIGLCETLMGAKVQEAPVTLRLAAQGGCRWLETKGIRIDWCGQKALIFFLMDVTERRRAERALVVSEQRYRLMAENAQDVIWVADIDRQCLTYVSPSIYALRGISVEEALRESLADSMPPDSYKRLQRYFKQRLKDFNANPSGGRRDMLEIEQYAKGGGIVCTEVSLKLQLGGGGRVEAVGISRDITKRKASERHIRYLNSRDALTGLYNRWHYTQRRDKLNTKANLPLTLVLIDVNGLKLMNDAFGHLAGDELLVSFARTLQDSLRATDIAARIGGDEFVLLLPKTGAEAAEIIVERIRSALSQKTVKNVPISASFGIATKFEPGGDFGGVYREAESRMYREKLILSQQTKASTLKRILSALYEKCEAERRHAESVSGLCMEIGRALNFTRADVQELGVLGLYHDIGKIAVDESLLNKPGKLDNVETSEMRRHPEIGYHILRSFSGMGEIAECALAHHRRVDGAGYPNLPLEDMPLKSRILSVAEAYDMMTGRYPFRDALEPKRAVEELKARAGSQFDGEIVRVFAEKVFPLIEKGACPAPGEDGLPEQP